MNTLSRREEDALVKSTKTKALQECDQFVQEFAKCAAGRTVSVVWACRDSYKELQGCMGPLMSSDRLEMLRREYIRQRDSEKQSNPT